MQKSGAFKAAYRENKINLRLELPQNPGHLEKRLANKFKDTNDNDDEESDEEGEDFKSKKLKWKLVVYI